MFIVLTAFLVKRLDITWVFCVDIALWGILMLTLLGVLKRRERTSL